jgi:hypothetical protein
MSENPAPGTDSDGDEHELCPQCMAGNRPGSAFCRECGAPLSAYAATGPFESAFAQGNLYRRASEQPRNLFVVVGVWLIFAGVGVVGAVMVVGGWNAGGRGAILVGLGLLAFSVTIIAKTTKNYRNREVPLDEEND